MITVTKLGSEPLPIVYQQCIIMHGPLMDEQQVATYLGIFDYGSGPTGKYHLFMAPFNSTLRSPHTFETMPGSDLKIISAIFERAPWEGKDIDYSQYKFYFRRIETNIVEFNEKILYSETYSVEELANALLMEL